jgi:hypothetical protein
MKWRKLYWLKPSMPQSRANPSDRLLHHGDAGALVEQLRLGARQLACCDVGRYFKRSLPWRELRGKLERISRSKRALVLSLAVVGRGPDVYAAACKMGLEGIVSKRVDAPYRSGKVKTWVKGKTRTRHASRITP